MKIYKALLNIEKQCPELFLLVNSLKIETCEKCPTAYAKKTGENTFKIVINQTWHDDFNEFNLSALIEHELLHVVLDHCSSLESYHDKQKANIAMDAIINDIGHFLKQKDSLNETLKEGIFLDNLNKKHKTDFSSYSNTALDIYNFLSTLNEKDLEKIGQPFDTGIEAGENEESRMPGSEGDSIDLRDLVSQSDYESIIKKYSRESSDIKTKIAEIEKIKNNAKIRKEIEKFFQSNKADKKQSIKRRNRRYSHLPYGRISAKRQKILLALDVSGSMLNPDDFAKMKMVVNSATSNMFEIDLIFGDTKKIGEYKNIKKSFDFENNIHGGGGTRLDFIFEEKINDYDCFVIVTDGQFNHNEVPNLKNRFLFLVTDGERYKIEGHKNIFI